jgi:hypothetical protein
MMAVEPSGDKITLEELLEIHNILDLTFPPFRIPSSIKAHLKEPQQDDHQDLYFYFRQVTAPAPDEISGDPDHPHWRYREFQSKLHMYSMGVNFIDERVGGVQQIQLGNPYGTEKAFFPFLRLCNGKWEREDEPHEMLYASAFEIYREMQRLGHQNDNEREKSFVKPFPEFYYIFQERADRLTELERELNILFASEGEISAFTLAWRFLKYLEASPCQFEGWLKGEGKLRPALDAEEKNAIWDIGKWAKGSGQYTYYGCLFEALKDKVGESAQQLFREIGLRICEREVQEEDKSLWEEMRYLGLLNEERHPTERLKQLITWLYWLIQDSKADTNDGVPKIFSGIHRALQFKREDWLDYTTIAQRVEYLHGRLVGGQPCPVDAEDVIALCEILLSRYVDCKQGFQFKSGWDFTKSIYDLRMRMRFPLPPMHVWRVRHAYPLANVVTPVAPRVVGGSANEYGEKGFALAALAPPYDPSKKPQEFRTYLLAFKMFAQLSAKWLTHGYYYPYLLEPIIAAEEKADWAHAITHRLLPISALAKLKTEKACEAIIAFNKGMETFCRALSKVGETTPDDIRQQINKLGRQEGQTLEAILVESLRLTLLHVCMNDLSPYVAFRNYFMKPSSKSALSAVIEPLLPPHRSEAMTPKIESVQQWIEEHLQEVNITINANLAGAFIPQSDYAHYLRAIFDEIFANAFKYVSKSNDELSIRIEASVTEDRAYLEVSNTSKIKVLPLQNMTKRNGLQWIIRIARAIGANYSCPPLETDTPKDITTWVSRIDFPIKRGE